MINSKIRDRKFLIYFASILAYFVLYAQLNSDAFRGEMWELLVIASNNQSWTDKFKEISGFVCFGSGRFQPLAFFVPYLHAVAFNYSFVYSHLFAQFLHLGCCLMTSFIAYHWTGRNSLAAIVFLVTMFSFLAADVIGWTFFTYIQLHALMLLVSIFLTKKYLEKNKKLDLVIAGGLAVVSSLMYEAGISLLISQILIIVICGISVKKRRFIFNALIPLSFLLAYLLLAFCIGGFNYKDSSATFQAVTFLKPIFYTIYYIRYSMGFSSEAVILNIGWIYKLKLELGLLDYLILISSFIFIAFTVKLSSIKQIREIFYDNKSTLFIVLLLYFYILVIAYGRVPKDAKFLDSTGLETQFRYYYMACFLFPLISIIYIGKIIQGRIYWYSFLTLVTFVVLGNIINIEKYNQVVALANLPLTNHSNKILVNQIGDELSKKENLNKYISQMHRDWYLNEVVTPRVYRPWVFNANTCIEHPEYKRAPTNKKFQITTSQDGNVNIPLFSSLEEVDLMSAGISSNSQHEGAGPKEAISGKGMWHVNHIPLPPQESWVVFDFKDHPIRISGMSFLPRQNGGLLFWDEAIIQGSVSDGEWEDIIKIGITSPPPDGWINIPFHNTKSFNKYRLKILGGFSSERFIALAGIKAYKLSARN